MRAQRRSRAGLAVAGVVVTLLSLTACNSGGGSGQGSSPAPTGTVPGSLQQQQAKVNAAQSAVSAADSDAANDPNE